MWRWQMLLQMVVFIARVEQDVPATFLIFKVKMVPAARTLLCDEHLGFVLIV